MLYRVGGLNADASAPLRIRGGASNDLGIDLGKIYKSVPTHQKHVENLDDRTLAEGQTPDVEGQSAEAFEPARADLGNAVGSERWGTADYAGQVPSGQRLLGAGRAAVVIVAHNRQDCLKLCLNSLLAQQDVSFFQVAVSLDDPPTFDKMEATAREVARGHDVMIWHKPPGDPKIPTVT